MVTVVFGGRVAVGFRVQIVGLIFDGDAAVRKGATGVLVEKRRRLGLTIPPSSMSHFSESFLGALTIWNTPLAAAGPRENFSSRS